MHNSKVSELPIDGERNSRDIGPSPHTAQELCHARWLESYVDILQRTESFLSRAQSAAAGWLKRPPLLLLQRRVNHFPVGQSRAASTVVQRKIVTWWLGASQYVDQSTVCRAQKCY